MLKINQNECTTSSLLGNQLEGVLPARELDVTGERSGTMELESNKEAERALMDLEKKLSPELSVECSVNELITTARSDQLLARMFPGWQSWL